MSILSTDLSNASINCARRLNEILALYESTPSDSKGLSSVVRAIEFLNQINNTKRLLLDDDSVSEREEPTDYLVRVISIYNRLIRRLANFLDKKSYLDDATGVRTQRVDIIAAIQAHIDSKTLQPSVVNDGTITGFFNLLYWYILEAFICARYLKLRYKFLLFKLKNEQFGDLAFEIEMKFADFQGSKTDNTSAWSSNSDSSTSYIAHVVENPTDTKFDFKKFQTENSIVDIFTIADSS